MANATPSRLGQVDQAGANDALFVKTFTGEVLAAFIRNCILKDRQRKRTIMSGKSASFAATYKATGGYHTPGAEILGDAISHNEVIINIDDLLVSSVFIADIEEAKNHYEVRSEYSNAVGEFLAEQYDANVARNIIRAARGGALFTGDQGGSALTDADGDTSATSLAATLWLAKQTMEEADVPVEQLNVWASLLPAQWYLLAQEPTLILNRDVGGDGNYSQGTFKLIGGVEVGKSNNLPWGVDDSANTDLPVDYRISMATTIGSVHCEPAIATVQLKGLQMESGWDMRRQGTLMIGKYAVGHGPLRNKCAVEIKTA